MSLQLNIRKYEEKDFERLCQVHDPARKSELEYAGLPAAFLPLSIAAEREGLFEYQVYVAEDKGLVVGFIAFSDTELAWLYVDRSCARQGVGSELMRFALERVQDDAEIEVLDGNEPALALYAKFGFTFLIPRTRSRFPNIRIPSLSSPPPPVRRSWICSAFSASGIR